MFKAVICCLNSKYIHSSLAPWCLLSSARAVLGENEAEICVSEGTINEDISRVTERLKAEKADAAAFCCYIWNIKSVLWAAEMLKKENPGLAVILGGPEVGFSSAEILEQNSFVDFVLCGEGEEAFPRLISALSRGDAPPDGLASMKTETGISLGAFHTAESSVSPYCEEYLASLAGRIAYIEASRGCPYSCAFCLSGEERTVRFFDLDRVKKEMLLLARSGTKTIKFVDRTFNCKKDRANEILLFIKEHYGREIPRGVCFHFEIAADILDDETLEIISAMPKGSVQFEAGIQSFNEKTLAAVNRKTNLERLCRNIKKLVSFRNCHIHIDLIAGLPFEDMSSLKESFNRAYALSADMLQLGFLKVLRGSCLESEKEKLGLVYNTEPPYEIISTPCLSREELDSLHRFEDAFERLSNSGRFEGTLKYVLEKSKLSPFDLFSGFAEFLSKSGFSCSSLDSFTSAVLEHFSAIDGVDKTALRDKIIFDRLCTNSSGIIPECLKIKDERLKDIRRKLAAVYPPEKSTKRTAAVLYSTNEVVFCDYKQDRQESFSPVILPIEKLTEQKNPSAGG